MQKLKYLLSLCLYSTLSLTFIPVYADTAILSVLAFENPPFITQRENSFGLYFDKVERKLVGSNVEVFVHLLSLPRVELKLREGNWCASTIKPIKKTDKVTKVQFNNFRLKRRLYRVRGANVFSWNKLSELKGFKIAILRSRNNMKFDAPFVEAGLSIIHVNTFAQAFKLLSRSRVDLVLSNNLSSHYFMAKMGIDYREIQESKNIISVANIDMWLNLKCLSVQKVIEHLKKN